MHFQDIISTLNRFWAERGCLILQPYDTEKGAGTMSPHTVLRAIGPEPWAVAYPEPCRRPTDGRYGDNPNRAQHYFQYQVLIKPSPDGIQETYLASLEALGIRARDHDIRFVEDNWESPTLGAWGDQDFLAQICSSVFLNCHSLNGFARSRLLKTLLIHQIWRPPKARATRPSWRYPQFRWSITPPAGPSARSAPETA